MTQFINLQPSAVKIRALAVKGLPIFGVTSTHQPHRPHAGRDARDRWMGGYFSSGERGAHKHPQPAGFPMVLGSPPSRHDPPGLAPVSPRLGSSSGDIAGNVWGRQGGLVWGERREGR